MKNKIFLLGTIILAVIVFSSCQQEHSSTPKNANLKVFDTAMLMLKEFVGQSKDSMLGFKNAEEAGRARIAIDEAVPMAILGLGKKLQAAGDMTQDSLHLVMTRLNRIVYPVYLDSELRAGITFDTTWNGWHPVIFDDAGIFGEINGYYRKLSQTERKKGKHLLVMAPQVQGHMIAKSDSTGDYFYPSAEVKRSMAENYPDSPDPLKVEKEKFLAGLTKHMNRREKLNKERIKVAYKK
jgi:hypothetical protein